MSIAEGGEITVKVLGESLFREIKEQDKQEDLVPTLFYKPVKAEVKNSVRQQV